MRPQPVQGYRAAIDSVEDRLLAEGIFDELRARTFDGVGITRVCYSAEETAALDIIEAKSRAYGLQTERDAGANLVVTLAGSEPDLPFLACGSHLDSVPHGGNFDGAAGVVAGLAILARFVKTGFKPRRTIKLYGLRGEESARFGKAYIGSSALLGALTRDDLAATDHTSGKTLAECMLSVGVDVDRVARGQPLIDANRLAAWLELHIEQGPVLMADNLPIGIVTGIRGNLRHRVVECLGTSDHSGTVPRSLRRDALFAAAELITHLDNHWQKLLERDSDIVITSGMFGTDPEEHAIARIPGKVRFSFEIRSQSQRTMETFYDFFRSECTLVGKARSVDFDFDRRLETIPATMNPNWVHRLKTTADALGIPAKEMPSGAGHDAAVFANAGIPSAMIFVRNEHGSHNPREAMELNDFLAGIAVMRAAIVDAVR